LLKASKNRIAAKLTISQKRFAAEVIGTFIVVVLATGSVVIDAKLGGKLGLPFIAFAPFVGTLGFLISGHITKFQLLQYFAAEIAGALLASLFVMSLIGTEASLGANAPDYSYPLPLVFGIEVLATALLMAVIYLVVYTKGLRRLGGLAIGGIVGLDIFFLAFISGASMNPARSLAPALLSGVLGNLWIYWTATFIGSSTVAFLVRRKLRASRQSSNCVFVN
jgi:aquaporin Z